MTEDRTQLDAAQELASWGLNVLPAKRGGNHPRVEWKRYQNERTDEMLEVWFGGATPLDFWIATGAISGVVVLDCDNVEADTYWRERIGAAMDETVAVRTKRGYHYYFRLPEGEGLRSWSVHPTNGDDGEVVAGAPSFDVRGDLTGVICPPSSGKSWIRSPAEWSMEPVPDELRRRVEIDGGQGSGQSEDGGSRSLLTTLLNNPGKGGYNNWFTAVCGHYAKLFARARDAYEHHCWEAYEKLRFDGSEPHPREHAEKTLESIWRSEQAKGDAAGVAPTDESGYLKSGGNVILTTVRSKIVEPGGKERYEYGVDTWADFDLVALGVVEDEDANRTYDVEVVRRRRGDSRRAILPSKVIADTKQLNTWLAEHGVFITPPDNMHPKSFSPSTRIGLYLEAQNPPQFRVVEHLGWHDGDGFVTHEGVITADGMVQHRGIKPHPRLRNWAPYRYGFASEDQARRVLNELLTFHDETVCSVFGSWWAACMLKPQIHRVSSQFPFMALEAPSESGKTTGFFPLMLQLAGNTLGNTNPTKAALRDYISAHQSGIVWIDDLDDVSHLMELLRQATGEGSVAKKGEDRTENQSVQLVAPIVISGEALQLDGQKALADRAIQLPVPSPTSRKSRKPGRSHLAQWGDIVDFKRDHPDLTKYTGTLVQMALRCEDLVEGLPALAGGTGGRFGDKIGVLRLGAGILAALTGDEEHIARVEAFCAGVNDVGSENALTLRILPEALRGTNWRRTATGASGRWPITPALEIDGEVWFNPQLLATWWDAFRNGRVEVRTETASALEQQAGALGLGADRKRFRVDADQNRKVTYWRLGGFLAELVLGRSRGSMPVLRGQGEVAGTSPQGVHPETMRLLALEAWTKPEHAQAPGE